MARRGEQAQRIGSRLVQVGFLIVLLVLWYLATNRWGVNRLLLPNPVSVWHQLVDVLRSGEYLPDLRVTLTELAAAFVLSVTSGTLVGYLVSRYALYDPRVRAAVRRHLFDPDHPVPAALRAVLRPRPGLQDRARHHHQLFSRSCSHHRRLQQCRPHARHRGALDGRIGLSAVPLRAGPRGVAGDPHRPAHGLHRGAALHHRQRDHRLARRPRPSHRRAWPRAWIWRACSPTSPSWS